MQRRIFKESAPLNQRLTEQAERLRKEAQGTPPGIMRDKLIRQARQAQTACICRNGFPLPASSRPAEKCLR